MQSRHVTLIIGLFSFSVFADTPIATYNGHSYQGISGPMTWKESSAYCQSKGGYLATVTSSEENDFVWKNVAAGMSGGGVWIGGWDLGNHNWTWVTGEESAYTNWNSGEPNDSGDSMQMITGSGAWDDYCGADETSWACNSPSSQGFICEWDNAVGGSVTSTGLSTVICKNVTTGQSLTIKRLKGAASWDCTAAGLKVNKGDIIRETLTGTVK